MGLFGDLFSTKPAENAARDKISGINTGLSTANSTLDSGLVSANNALDVGQSQANPLYGQAYGDFSSLASKYGRGQDTYNDATGVNGAAGISRAGSLYKSLPGYSGGLTTGIDAVDRGAAARGALGGGNTSADIIKFASDYDANKYGNFVSNLAPNLAGVSSATAGGAGVLGNEAAANLGVAGTRASAGLGVAGTKANLDYTGNTAIGNANADKDLAPYAASQNFWGALMGGANLLGKATGVGGFAPSGASSIGGAGTGSLLMGGFSPSGYGR